MDITHGWVCERSLILNLKWFTVWIFRQKRGRDLQSFSMIQMQRFVLDDRRQSCLHCVSSNVDGRNKERMRTVLDWLSEECPRKLWAGPLLLKKSTICVFDPASVNVLWERVPGQCHVCMEKTQSRAVVCESKKMCNLMWSSGEKHSGFSCWDEAALTADTGLGKDRRGSEIYNNAPTFLLVIEEAVLYISKQEQCRGI